MQSVWLCALFLASFWAGVLTKSFNDEPSGQYCFVRFLDGSKKRSADFLPDSLPVEIETEAEIIHLRLKRNAAADKVKMIVAGDDGERIVGANQMQAHYSDVENSAIFTVTTDVEANTMQLKGTVNIRNKRYTISPTKVSADVLSSFRDGITGEAHLLEASESSSRHIRAAKSNKKSVDIQLKKEAKVVKKGSKGKAERHEKKEPKFSFKGSKSNGGGNGGGNHGNRKKRAFDASQTNYFAEFQFVLDHTIYDSWMVRSDNNDTVAMEGMREYYLHILLAMQMVFNDLNLKLWLQNIYVAKTKAQSVWTHANIANTKPNPVAGCSNSMDFVVDTDLALESIRQWRSDQGNTWNSPDHIMVMTMYDLSKGGSLDNAYLLQRGGADKDGICMGDAYPIAGVSVVEDHGIHSARHAVYELAYNLGASKTADCNGGSNKIMDPNLQIKDILTGDDFADARQFSSCSIAEMQSVITGTAGSLVAKRTCLYDNACTGTAVAGLYGESHSADEQCAFEFGAGSTMCSSPNICQNMGCSNVYQSGSCNMGTGVRAADGTNCGTGMWCLASECVANDPSAVPTIYEEASCEPLEIVPSGCHDKTAGTFTTTITISGVPTDFTNCDDIARATPSVCMDANDHIRKICAETCHKYGLYDVLHDPCEEYGDGNCQDESGDVERDTDGDGVSDVSKNCVDAAAAEWCLLGSSVFDYCCKSCSDTSLTDYCVTNPCQNGGTCVLDVAAPFGNTCDCVTGFTGDNCQWLGDCTDYAGLWGDDDLTCAQIAAQDWCIDYTNVPVDCCHSCSDPTVTQYCTPNPCNNGGVCGYEAPEVGYSCDCGTDFSGDHCQWTGTCSDYSGTLNGLTCSQAAAAGWCISYTNVADYCCPSCSDPDVTQYCLPNPCLNGGVCAYDFVDLTNGFDCQCVDDWTGADCGQSSCSDNDNYTINVTYGDGSVTSYDCDGLMAAHSDSNKAYFCSMSSVAENCCVACTPYF